MNTILQYFMSVRTKTGDTYSIDKLILDFKLRYRSGGEWAAGFLSFLSDNSFVFFDHWTTSRIGTYREQFSIDCGDGNSFWVGVGLNEGTGRVINRVRLEFNPNKVAENRVFCLVFNQLFVFASGPPGVVRFDLAVDFPVLRSDCWLLKDRRMYEEVRKSDEDRTQYLGERNKPGRCKLYNKALESKLKHPLSRLEITISGDSMAYEQVLAIWPRVMVWDDLQLVFDDNVSGLTGTDRFILKSLIMEPGRLDELARVKQKKIGCILDRYTRFIEIDKLVYETIISQLYIYSQEIPWNGAGLQ